MNEMNRKTFALTWIYQMRIFMFNSDIIAIRIKKCEIMSFMAKVCIINQVCTQKNKFFINPKLRISCETRAKIREKALTVGSLAIKWTEKIAQKIIMPIKIWQFLR